MNQWIIAGIVSFTAWQTQAQTSNITLGQSAQTITLTGLGTDSNGNANATLTWSDCSYDGTNTNCTLSGPFTGLGAGGTWNLTLTYPGNGPSPATAVYTPGSTLFSISVTSGYNRWIFSETNGPTVTFYYLTGLIFYVQGQYSCSGNVPSCDGPTVAATPGASVTGYVNGSFNSLPQIQAAITASSYGGSASIAPATWIEIYGLNVATDTPGEEWSGSNFTGNNAPTNLGNTTVTVGGQSAFVDYISAGQVNAQVPSNIGTGQQPVVVTTLGGSSEPFMVNVNATQAALLAPPSFDVKGTQYVVALFPNQLYVLPPKAIPGIASQRALPGDTILLYGIGFGPLGDGTPAGVIDTAQNQLTASLDVSIGGTSAKVAYAGLTPGFVGLYQFNIVVPNVPASDQTPLTFTLNGTPGAQTLNLAIGN